MLLSEKSNVYTILNIIRYLIGTIMPSGSGSVADHEGVKGVCFIPPLCPLFKYPMKMK